MGLELGERYFRRHPLSPQQHSVLFAAWSLLCAAGAIPFWGRWWPLLALLSMSAVFAYASVGVVREWPGFGPEPDPDEDEADEDDA